MSQSQSQSQSQHQLTNGVKIWIDKDFLQATKGAGEMLTSLQSNNINCIIDKLPVSNSLFWTRTDSSRGGGGSEDETQHDHILVRVDWSELVDGAAEFLQARQTSELGRFIDRIKADSQCNQVTFLVFEFKKNWKNFKGCEAAAASSKTSSKGRSGNKPVAKSDLNELRIALELEENVQVRGYDEPSDLKDLVMSYTKSVAEYASRHLSIEQAMFSEIEKAQTKIGKDGQNMINLWKELVQSFPLVSSDQAQAICAVYPSPLLLKQAFDKGGSMILADIQVRRGAGVLSNVRRIGPELSQKLHKFFTSIKPNELLVNS